MAFSKGCVTLFLILLSLCFISTSTLARPYNMFDIPNDLPRTTDEPWPNTSTLSKSRTEAVVDIRSDLPNTDEDYLIIACNCDYANLVDVKLGQHYNRTVRVDQDLQCYAEWSRWFTNWNAYDSKKDKGHDTIYWSVQEDGFYHSWDGSKWEYLNKWQTE